MVARPDRVRDETPHERARRRLEAERALRHDPVDHDAEEQPELRSDISADELGQFLGVVIDGIVSQRALGFDPPASDLVRRLVNDAIVAGDRDGRD